LRSVASCCKLACGVAYRYWLTNSAMMKRYLPFVIVALVAMLTVGTGTMLYRAKRTVTLTVPKGVMD